MRLLGVDFGFKRIGIAVAVTDPCIVTARPTIEASGALKTDAASLAEMARKEEVDQIVLGLPIEESGDEGKMARICRLLAGHLTDMGCKVALVDERMTSVEAEARIRTESPTPSPIPQGRSTIPEEGISPTPNPLPQRPFGFAQGRHLRSTLRDGA